MNLNHVKVSTSPIDTVTLPNQLMRTKLKAQS